MPITHFSLFWWFGLNKFAHIFVLLLCFFCSKSQQDARLLVERALKVSTLDSAILYGKTNLKNALKSRNAATISEAYCLMGRLYNKQSSLDEASLNLNSGLSVARRSGLELQAAHCLAELARNTQLKADPATALQQFIEALSYFEKTGDLENQARLHIYIGEYYRNLARFDEAIVNIWTAFAIHKKQKLSSELEILLYNRASAIKSESHYVDSALYLSKVALTLARKENDQQSEAVSLNEIGFIYENKNKFDDAVSSYKQAEELWAKARYIRYWARAAENRARCYAKTGDRKKSNALLMNIADTLKTADWALSLLTIYEQMSRNFREMNDWANADKYYIKFMEEDVRLYKKEHAKELEEVKTRYETEKNKGKIREQQNQLNIAEIGYKEERFMKTMAICGAILLLIVVAVISYMFIQRNKLNAELVRKNTEIGKVNSDLSASLHKSEILMREVHHRVKNNLQIISSMFNLQADSAPNDTIRNILMESDNRVMMIAYLHERLYSKDDVGNIDIREFITEVTNNIFQSYRSQSSDITFESDVAEIQIEMDKAVVLGIITNELVTNSVKHAFPAEQVNRVIRVSIGMKENSVFLRISDNGRGLPESFSLANSGSFGLKLVNIMIQHVKGTVKIYNNGGANIEILI